MIMKEVKSILNYELQGPIAQAFSRVFPMLAQLLNAQSICYACMRKLHYTAACASLYLNQSVPSQFLNHPHAPLTISSS